MSISHDQHLAEHGWTPNPKTAGEYTHAKHEGKIRVYLGRKGWHHHDSKGLLANGGTAYGISAASLKSHLTRLDGDGEKKEEVHTVQHEEMPEPMAVQIADETTGRSYRK